MAKVVKQFALKFYDTPRDQQCLEWLEAQVNMSESIKNVIAEKVKEDTVVKSK